MKIVCVFIRSLLSHLRFIAIVLLPLLMVTTVYGGSESLRPDGDPAPNHMSIQNSTRHGATSDDNDATYIYTSSPGAEKLSFADNTTIPSDAILDSLVIEFRAKKNFGVGTARLRARIFRGPSKYCDSDEWSISASWTNHRFAKFEKAPSSAGSCTDSWTRPLVDSLDVQINVVQGGDEPKVAEIWAHFYWTEAGATAPIARRRKLLLSGS